MITIPIHSIVDLITNSSTTIFSYQNSVNQAKELVQEMLNLSGITDKSPDDIFYYGVFCEEDRYLEHLDEIEDREDIDFPDVTAEYGTDEYKEQTKKQVDAFNNLKLSIMKGEVESPSWMNDAEVDDDSWSPSSYLTLVPKEDKYEVFGTKIKSLLNSIDSDGGRDG